MLYWRALYGDAWELYAAFARYVVCAASDSQCFIACTKFSGKEERGKEGRQRCTHKDALNGLEGYRLFRNSTTRSFTRVNCLLLRGTAIQWDFLGFSCFFCNKNRRTRGRTATYSTFPEVFCAFHCRMTRLLRPYLGEFSSIQGGHGKHVVATYTWTNSYLNKAPIGMSTKVRGIRTG